MIRSHRLRVLGRYLLSAALVLLAIGALSQVPRSAVDTVIDTGIEAVLGRDVETYDEAARRSAESRPTAGATETSPDASTERHGPLTLHVAAWDEDFRVVDIAVDDAGALVPPGDVSTLGRWDRSAWPGEGTGTGVLVVHRDSAEQGRGPFAELEHLPVGSEVTLDGCAYRLAKVDTYAKTDLPAEKVFGQGGAERLVIVTCGGSYSPDRGWDSNVVATFRPAAAA
ncbi:class F sortase [Nocardioides dongkuii]|uniref:class F sortase n=1 Tax=Nocardioides dongkuii TaxID=2760089 RepID=UPI0015FC822D|nr:class F sortase [Nocardioides dongkuii]